ncbi:MAG: hypothetical protein LBQ24_04745, partial [Candidatus Peribacteria bacterium]|nr:hypothetical protein [Candidatus Peribacteria bacterium]
VIVIVVEQNQQLVNLVNESYDLNLQVVTHKLVLLIIGLLIIGLLETGEQHNVVLVIINVLGHKLEQ